MFLCLIDSGWYNAFIILLFVANFFRERRGFLGVILLGMVLIWYMCQDMGTAASA